MIAHRILKSTRKASRFGTNDAAYCELTTLNLSIINSFVTDQRRAKQIVSEKLGVPVDIAALHWASLHRKVRDAYDASPFADIFRPHGYGLELQIAELYIDYDYSETGRADGFDAWRIFTWFMAGQFDNRSQDKYILDQIHNWIESLALAGRIQKLDNLYYYADSQNG